MNYNRVPSGFWTEGKVLNWDDQTKLLALYLLTSPHRAMEGIYRLPMGYIAADLNWSMEELDKTFAQLIEDGFVKYDKETKLIMLRRVLQYQPPANPNQEKAAIAYLKELPRTDLLEDYINEARSVKGSFYQRLVEEFGVPDISKNTIHAKEKTITSTSKVDIETEKEEKREIAEVIFDCDSLPFKATCYLIDRIVGNNSRARVPDKDPADHKMQKWCQEMERLNRLGPLGAKEGENKGYSWTEIRDIIDWCQEDSFWQANILSTAKLRKQVIKLENRMKRSHVNKSEKKIEMLKEIYAEAQEEDGRGEIL